jgi:hypothetical protein
MIHPVDPYSAWLTWRQNLSRASSRFGPNLKQVSPETSKCLDAS